MGNLVFGVAIDLSTFGIDLRFSSGMIDNGELTKYMFVTIIYTFILTIHTSTSCRLSKHTVRTVLCGAARYRNAPRRGLH